MHFGAKLHQKCALQFAAFARQNAFLKLISANLGAK
jgi:hypothetical protein